jgi:transcriptional regulator with XRE-family HTH domain
MTVGQKIRNCRLKKGYTQENMAELLDISVTSYAKIERDETNVGYNRLEQIANVLEINLIELLSTGEANFYYFHDNKQNGTYGGFVVNHHKMAETEDLRLELIKLNLQNEKLLMENEYLKEMVNLMKSK